MKSATKKQTPAALRPLITAVRRLTGPQAAGRRDQEYLDLLKVLPPRLSHNLTGWPVIEVIEESFWLAEPHDKISGFNRDIRATAGALQRTTTERNRRDTAESTGNIILPDWESMSITSKLMTYVLVPLSLGVSFDMRPFTFVISEAKERALGGAEKAAHHLLTSMYKASREFTSDGQPAFSYAGCFERAMGSVDRHLHVHGFVVFASELSRSRPVIVKEWGSTVHRRFGIDPKRRADFAIAQVGWNKSFGNYVGPLGWCAYATKQKDTDYVGLSRNRLFASKQLREGAPILYESWRKRPRCLEEAVEDYLMHFPAVSRALH
ncbi:MAG: hypothetical protein VYB54_09180 [Pseudomonadota bacterium]|nr:hypothetical protein [Pseudomonadota bacterium]